jgi:hypothetical protein
MANARRKRTFNSHNICVDRLFVDSVESGAADSQAEDAPNDYAADDRLLQRPSAGGAALPQTPPGLIRPIPQTYMIRQPAPPDYGNAGSKK